MGKLEALVEALDHPVTFIILVTLGVFATAHVLVYMSDKLGAPSVKAFFQL